MIKHLSKDTLFLILLFLGVLISRVPFIENGYGIDPDSWRVASVANAISTIKHYTASRLPGYPVQEITYALLPIKNAAVFNFFTAFLSSLCVLYFAKFIKILGIKHFVYPSVAFAFVPIIYINSTNSMDYIWALCFIVVSFYFAISQKIFLSGFFIGIAAGCRITSAGMLLPLFVLLQNTNANKFYRNFGTLLSGFLTTFVIAFLPVVLKYGLRFFSFSSGNVPILYIVKSFTIDVWGIIGFLSLGFYSLFLLLRLFGRQQFREFTSDKINQVSLIVIALYIIAFVLAPYDPGYLIPIVPFTIILFTHNLSARQSIFYCLIIVLSSFAMGVNASDMPWRVEHSTSSYTVAIGQRPIEINLIRGPIIEDCLQRIARSTYSKKVRDFISTGEKNSVLISGIWFTQLAVEFKKTIKDNIEEFNSFEHKNFVVYDAIDNAMASRYREQNFSIYYLTGQDKSNFNLYGFHLGDLGANEVIF
jgi:hypothetical protein